MLWWNTIFYQKKKKREDKVIRNSHITPKYPMFKLLLDNLFQTIAKNTL